MVHEFNVTIGYDEFKKHSTGSHASDYDYKYITYRFDRYDIKIKLTPDNKFVSVEEVTVNREFLSNKEKASIKKYHEVDEYYKD